VIVLEFISAFVLLVLAICNILVGLHWFSPIATYQVWYDNELAYDEPRHCFLFIANIMAGLFCTILLFIANLWLIMFVPFFFINPIKNHIGTIKRKLRTKILNFLNEEEHENN